MPEPGDATVTDKSIRNLDAQTLPDEGTGWVTALQAGPGDDLPLYLQQPAQTFMWEPLQGGGGYVRLQAMENSRDQSMDTFFEENLKPLPDGSLQYLVVDFRANWGGNAILFVETAKWLPGKVADDGQLYIVVGPQTFLCGRQR